MRILYVPVSRPDSRLIKALGELNHRVEMITSREDALTTLRLEPFGTVILDLPAPSTDWAAAVASARSEAFLILIVAAGSSEGRAEVLRAGADACFVRPIHIGEIGGWLDALSRRVHRPAVAAFTLAPGQQSVFIAGERVALSRREYVLLETLTRSAGQVVSTQALLETVWGATGEHDIAAVRTCVARLRRKIEPRLGYPLISLERGHGYRVRIAGPT